MFYITLKFFTQDDFGAFFNLRYTKEEKVIIKGDVNITTSWVEIWGHNARIDEEIGYFKHKIENSGFIEVEPLKWVPTWRNNSYGIEGVAKRLDRFLVSESIMYEVGGSKSWVIIVGFFDHCEIILQIDG